MGDARVSSRIGAGFDIAAVSSRPEATSWRTEEGGRAVEYATEPARSENQRMQVEFLSLLPLDDEL